MSNRIGPLSPRVNAIRYKHPTGEEARYHLGCCWTSYGNYLEINGLDPDQPAGPWGGREIDDDRVILPSAVATKIAGAFLLDELRTEYFDPADAPLGADPDERAVLERVLRRVLAAELAESATGTPQ